MNKFIYAQLDNENYCTGISQLSGEVIKENLIKIDSYDESYINRKYDVAKKKWLDEYRPAIIEEPTQLDRLEDGQLDMMEGMATAYEQSLANADAIMIMMEGMADLYELMLGGN